MLDKNEHERRHDRDAGHVARAVAVDRHLAEREDGVDERRDEESDRELARLVPQDALHDARRELAHRELDDDHRDREDERGQAHHRGGDGRKDVGRSVRPADDARRQRVVVEVAVDSDRRRTRAAPASTQSTGTNQRLDLRWMNSLRSLMEMQRLAARNVSAHGLGSGGAKAPRLIRILTSLRWCRLRAAAGRLLHPVLQVRRELLARSRPLSFAVSAASCATCLPRSTASSAVSFAASTRRSDISPIRSFSTFVDGIIRPATKPTAAAPTARPIGFRSAVSLTRLTRSPLGIACDAVPVTLSLAPVMVSFTACFFSSTKSPTRAEHRSCS